MIVPSPPISASLPSEWDWKDSITLYHPSGQANVIFTTEPVPDDLDVGSYAEVQGKQLKDEFPGYDEQAAGEGAVFGRDDGYIRRFTWAPLDGTPVAQTQFYFVEGGRGYTATATVSLRYLELEPEVLAVLSSLQIGS